MIEKHYKRQLIVLKKKKRVVATIIITTATLKKQTTTFPWVPKIGPKIKKEIQKFGFRVAFQIGPNLKNTSCKNKDKLITNSIPGVYESKCSCGSVYNNESKKKIISRSIGNQKERIKSNWSSSGAIEHTNERHGHFDW